MKDIIVYSESFSSWRPHVIYAAELAAMLGASLSGACICPSPIMTMPVYEAPGLAMQFIEEARELLEDAQAAESSFLAFASKHDVRDATWQVADGYIPESLELIANWHDLLVLGRNNASPWGSASSIGDIMLNCGLPCIIVPEAWEQPFTIDRIAIAWNGTPEAVCAVHAAMPLLKRASHIVVLGHAESLVSQVNRWIPGFDLQTFLQRHGIQAQSVPLLKPEDQDIGAALLQTASQQQADLLVMGGYGHARLREWILGGATREVLERSTMPVFMRH